LRSCSYGQAAQRIAEEFTRLYNLLILRTRNDPNRAASIRKEEPELDEAIGLLEEIERALDEPSWQMTKRDPSTPTASRRRNCKDGILSEIRRR
jgi:hypothetical protein